MIRFLAVFFLLLISTPLVSQTAEDTAQIEILSKKLIQTLKDDNWQVVEDYLANKDDIREILEKARNSFDSVEYANMLLLIDSLPQKYKENFLQELKRIRTGIANAIDNSRFANYLSSEIEPMQYPNNNVLTVKVLAKFALEENVYFINYECSKLSRRWILGDLHYVRRID